MQSRQVPVSVLALILWIATAVVGLWEIVIVRGMLLRLYAYFGGEYWPAVNMGNWIVFILGATWLVLVVGGGEYHYRRVGQRGSWRLFGWTIGVEIAILVLALFI